MRKILFRGKRRNIDEWTYGYLMKDKDERTYIFPNGAENVLLMYETEPETLGQFTGLYDKNGNRIFEGDIVREVVKNKRTGYVAWLQQECGFVIVWEESDSRLGHRSRGGGYENDPSLEIIGNIYDNPKLLEKSKI